MPAFRHRRLTVPALVLLICLGLATTAAAEPLLLYSGAGLRQPVEKLVQLFQDKTGVQVRIDFAGSGQLMARYLASGRGDVFLPGSHFYVNKLKDKGEIVWSRKVVLHVPVIGFPLTGRIKISSFDDLTKSGVKVGLGDPKAMALGRTAEDILAASGQGEAVLKNTVVRAATVKQLVLYLLKNDVDAAIVARADVVQKKDKLGMVEIDPAWYKPEIVTAGVLKATNQAEAAQKLAEFLSSPLGVEVFAEYGFLPVK